MGKNCLNSNNSGTLTTIRGNNPYGSGIHFHFKKLTTISIGYKMKVDCSSAKDCGKFPLRSKRAGKSEFKKINDTADKPLYDRMNASIQTSEPNE